MAEYLNRVWEVSAGGQIKGDPLARSLDVCAVPHNREEPEIKIGKALVNQSGKRAEFNQQK